MQYKASSPEDYIDQVPEVRRNSLKKLCQIIRDNLPNGFEEGIQYGMIGYYVPHSIYPDGYHCNTSEPLPFMSVASQKNAIHIYHSGIYAVPELHDWIVTEYPKYSKRKLDMGKSCIRFKHIQDISFELIGKLASKLTVKEWVAVYERNVKSR